MRIDQSIKKCFDKGIKVYPVYYDYRWYIEVEINGKTKRFPKPIKEIEINTALEKTYNHYAQKL